MGVRIIGVMNINLALIEIVQVKHFETNRHPPCVVCMCACLVAWPARFLCRWDSPGKNTGVGCHSLLQGIFPTRGANMRLPYCRQILSGLSHQGSSCGKFMSAIAAVIDSTPFHTLKIKGNVFKAQV